MEGGNSLKPLIFVLGVPKYKMEKSTEKKHISCRENFGKVILPPLKNIPLTLATVKEICLSLWIKDPNWRKSCPMQQRVVCELVLEVYPASSHGYILC